MILETLNVLEGFGAPKHVGESRLGEWLELENG